MKNLLLIFTLLFTSVFFSPNVVLSQTFDDLVVRDGLYYKKSSDVPFSGVTTGNEQGTIKNGIREGAWITYHPNAQLKSKGNYKNGKTDGSWVYNYEIGVMN